MALMLNAKGMTPWSVTLSTCFSGEGDQQSCLMTSLSPFSLQRPSKCFAQPSPPPSPPPRSHSKEAIPSLNHIARSCTAMLQVIASLAEVGGYVWRKEMYLLQLQMYYVEAAWNPTFQTTAAVQWNSNR